MATQEKLVFNDKKLQVEKSDDKMPELNEAKAKWLTALAKVGWVLLLGLQLYRK